MSFLGISSKGAANKPPNRTVSSTDAQVLTSEEVEQLYADVAPGLRAFLITLTDSESDASDCLQNSFITLALRGNQCAPGARRAWLYSVARNHAAALHRRKGARMRAFQKVAEVETREVSEAVDVILADERQESVRQAIAELSEVQRQVVLMRINEDLTFKEIARRLNIPLGTALARMQAAIKRLAGLLESIK